MPFDLARCDIADRTTIAGKGRPLVLVHGVGGPGVWRYVADLLAPRFRIIVPTFPGFLPADGRVPFSDDLHADFLEKVRAHFAIDRLSLVGLSLGGRTALNYALDHAPHVEKLVVIAAAGLRTHSPLLRGKVIRPILARAAARWLDNPRHVDRVALRDLVHHDAPAAQYNRERVAALVADRDVRANVIDAVLGAAIERDDWPARLPGLDVPTLVLWGSDDRTCPVADARRLCALLPDAQLDILRGWRHLAVLERPEYFAEQIAGFLRPAGLPLLEVR